MNILPSTWKPLGLGAALVFVATSPTASSAEVGAPDCSVFEEFFDARTSDDPAEVSWRMLAGLDFQTGEMTEVLEELVDKPVKIPGFTVPLEDFASSATEFLLVPFVGACVHTPPPPPNQLVYVVMDQGKRAKMDGWNPVWLEGTLHVEDVTSIYGSASYRVVGTSVTPYQ